MRCTALKLEMWLEKHPDAFIDEDFEWEDVGFDWNIPVIDRMDTQPRSPADLDESKLRVSRVRSMDHATDEFLQQRQSLLPSPRHLPPDHDPPSPAKALLAAPVLMVPRRDPTPEFPSKLRAMVQAQGDEALTQMHGDFEKFRITGKQPDRKNTGEGSGTKRYRASESSDYRPYSMSPAPTRTRTQAGTGPAIRDALGSEMPAAKRLRSTELFPDRYQVGEATSVLVENQAKARDSVGEGAVIPIRESAGEETGTSIRDSAREGTGVSRRDFAYSGDNTTISQEDDEQGKHSTRSDPEPSSVPSSRRSAARSDSSLSSNASTESSRAREALALTLSEDRRRVELNKEKSTASVGNSSNAPSLFRNFVNALSPSSSKASVEDATKKPLQTPTRRESSAGCENGSESSLDGTSEGGRMTRSSSKRSRANTVPASSSKRQQKRRQTDNNSDPIALLPGIGVSPEPSESDESSRVSSSKEGTTEGGEESHGNAVPTSVYPAESESCKPPV